MREPERTVSERERQNKGEGGEVEEIIQEVKSKDEVVKRKRWRQRGEQIIQRRGRKVTVKLENKRERERVH